MPATGGTTAATGGTKASGGAATGGTPATGGSKATGGAATGGTPATGGSKATGGAATGGANGCGTTMRSITSMALVKDMGLGWNLGNSMDATGVGGRCHSWVQVDPHSRDLEWALWRGTRLRH
jgi:hypothetical protein